MGSGHTARTSHRLHEDDPRLRDTPGTPPPVARPAPTGDRAGLLALQRTAGNQATGHYLALQRDDGAEPYGGRTPSDVATPPNLGPPVSPVPWPFTFNVGRDKKGHWYWKAENLPGLGSTPEVPLNPLDIPARVREILKGAGKPGDGKKPPVWIPPTPVDPGFAVEWAGKMCVREPDNPYCAALRRAVTPQPAPGPDPAAPGPDLGVLWTDRVTFLKDRPQPGGAGPAALTSDGKAVLASVLSWLKLDPKLRVRLIGSSSSEGGAEHNKELSLRRAQQIQRALAAAGFGDRLGDPFVPDGQESGCESAGPGIWSCGDAQASEEPDPADRAVKVTFFRAPDLSLTPPATGP